MENFTVRHVHRVVGVDKDLGSSQSCRAQKDQSDTASEMQGVILFPFETAWQISREKTIGQIYAVPTASLRCRSTLQEDGKLEIAG